MMQFFVKHENDVYREIILPDDYSVNMTENNPEINNEGDFTLDITANLKDCAQNAIAFRFIHRQNVVSIPKKLDAKAIIRGKTSFGTIINIKPTDATVTFQYVSGNSELNYIAKTEKKIWELEGWGTESAIDFNRALQSTGFGGYGLWNVFHGYAGDQVNFVCAPVNLGTEIVNYYTIASDTDGHTNEIDGVSGNIVMQPYLLYYINKLPELLGYTLNYNVLNFDVRAKVMYVVNSVNSLNYADALPDWTVTEFIEAVENYFNVSFLVNAATKSISIHSLSSSIAGKKVVEPTVLKSHSRTPSDESKSLKTDFTKISYDLGDSNFFRWHKLSDSILSNYETLHFDNLDAMKTWMLHNTSNLGKPLDKILHDTEKDDYYVHNTYYHENEVVLFAEAASIPGDFDALRILKLVNKFASIGSDDTRELVFKIVPAEFVKSRQSVAIAGGTTYCYFQMPKSSNQYYISPDVSLIQAVEGSESTIPRSTKLEVALYTGRIKTYFEPQIGYVYDIPTLWPFSHLDFMPEFTWTPDLSNLKKLKLWATDYFTPSVSKSLKLRGADGVVSDYHQETILNTSEEYEFTLLDGPDVTASNLYLINNLKYMPIKLERVITRTQKTVKGAFYRML